MTLNDFTLRPACGFEMHPHQEMEIISYCVDGELVHEDSLGNREIIQRGGMQYTCAGSGIWHSERNESLDNSLRFIQIWIRPNAPHLSPHYHSHDFKPSDRLNKMQQIASGQSIENGTQINQDVNIFVSKIQAGRQIELYQLPGRQAYLACLEGALGINKLALNSGDALKIWDEPVLTLTAVEDVQLIMVDMPVNL
jgi:redox-sensitive bicupin YhaK (pirin superfamily)